MDLQQAAVGAGMNPQYDGKPVILVHYSANATPPFLALCTGAPFHEPRDGAYPNVPLVPCPMCLYVVTRGVMGE